ncbi:unnamed protein product [Rotaria magnacalcarata]|nr:unnamed protein product [Rotaria magnacalcarata]CAF2023095.1 unnamed protein product [Rotaria magnacalcarata]CAF3814982.1 unnamed protein product [Rotaria magnacalcarata]
MSGLDKIKRIIVVLSGKGGVGKSTVTTQVALSLYNSGYRVGLLDVDLCGPSIPKMFGVDKNSKESVVYETPEGMTPVDVFATSSDSSRFKLISMALLLDSENDAVIWRGPRKVAMIQRLLTGVKWGELDYLIIDTPPGTSDEHIAVMTVLKQHEHAKEFLRAILVTTPQMLSINDVRREITFCHKTAFHIIGLIENMSGYVCPHCSECTNIFAQGGGTLLAEQYSIPFLGRLPIDNRLNTILDQGITKVDNGLETISETETMKLFKNIINQILDHWE